MHEVDIVVLSASAALEHLHDADGSSPLYVTYLLSCERMPSLKRSAKGPTRTISNSPIVERVGTAPRSGNSMTSPSFSGLGYTSEMQPLPIELRCNGIPTKVTLSHG